MKKTLLLVIGVFILCVSTAVYAQDLCQKMHDRYRICIEKQDAGKNMDYDMCKTYTDQTACEGGGCYWNEMKAKCTIDLCLTDSTYEDGYVNVADLGIYKNEYGRIDCPTIPLSQGPTEEELEARIVSLETQVAQLTALLANVTRVNVEGQDTIRFSNMNVHIVNGSGNTYGVNSLGNLIVGYNEPRLDGTDDRTGSHNIVVGRFNNYSSYGGLIAGQFNTISGPSASVSGGIFNVASSNFASVSGGHDNNANAAFASVSGGQWNIASGEAASVSGGSANTASGFCTIVGGGRNNQAMGNYSFVGGGGGENSANGNYAVGDYSSILGGSNNTAGDFNHIDTNVGLYSTVSGGSNNTASGPYASVSGGSNNTANASSASVSGGWNNIASGGPSSVSGGYGNTASGAYSSISGGIENEASGEYASISGGSSNIASGEMSGVNGGVGNTASYYYASVSGGNSNTASGWAASVSGGESHSATGPVDWRAGSCYFCDD